MKHVLCVIALVCCLDLCADELTVPLTVGLRTRVAEGDSVTWKQVDGLLQVRYDVAIRDTHQVGHETFRQADVDLLLKEPVELPPQVRRIAFETLGAIVGRKRPSEVIVSPLVRDTSGELFVFTPHPYPHLQAGSANWTTWWTTPFLAAEAGGATHAIYEAYGGDGNAWPDGKLVFAGFRLSLRDAKKDRVTGTVVLGDVRLLPVRPTPADPFVYADSLLEKPDTYTVAVQVRNRYQGTPVVEFAREVEYDPDSPASRKQRISFPLGRNGNYWIRYQVTHSRGGVVGGRTLRYQVVNRPDGPRHRPVDVDKAPIIGHLRVNPGRKAGGVYTPEEPLRVTVRAFARGRASLTLLWTRVPYHFETVVQRGKTTVEFGDRAYRDIVLDLEPDGSRRAWWLHLDAVSEGKTVDRRAYLVGIAGDKPQALVRQGKIPDRAEIKQHAYFRTTYLPPRNPDRTSRLKTRDEAVRHFETYLDQSRAVARHVTFMVDLVDFEVLPGVFCFDMLDGVMNSAAERGMAVTVRLAHADANGEYRWTPFYRQLNFDGTEINRHYYGSFAVTDPALQRMWLDAYRALYDRYHKHPGFQGYYIMEPAGESTVTDQPWEGVTSGYAPPDVVAFRRWLQEKLGLTLEQLNRRWGTRYKSFDEVAPPMPAFELGPVPDLSRRWVDFCTFKDSLNRDVWFPTAVRAIRSYDKRRVIIAYCPPNLNPDLFGLLDYGHNGGNHMEKLEGQLVQAWQKGRVGWITEPHHPHRWAAYGDPGQAGWVLDWSVYMAMAQAGGGGANFHVYYYPDPTLDLVAHYGGEYALDRVETFKPILRELHSFEPLEPTRQVAVLQDETTLYCKHRTVFRPRLADLKRWFELLKHDSVAHEPLQRENLDEYKLLVPNILDEVMTAQNVDLLVDRVKDGAKMIVTARTGMHTPGRPDESFVLLRALGIDPPAGDWVTSGRDVRAEVTGNNPLFEKGKSIDFFSLDQLKHDLAGDAVKKDFWRYPYRFIPLTDYFGHYPGHKPKAGRVVARFAGGGAALSLHEVGRGEVAVFWGVPDMREGRLQGMMARAAEWADAESPRRGSPVPYTLEGRSTTTPRRYALMYRETPGTCTQKLPTIPAGRWVVDDMVSQQRLGTWTGKELSERGITVTWVKGGSPLKVLRLIPETSIRARWLNKYRQPDD